MARFKPPAVSPTEIGTAIVVLLLGTLLVFPFLRHDTITGAREMCMRNLGQIGKSIDLYLADADGIYPRTTYERPKAGLGLHWAVLVQPYVKSEDIFVCLGDRPIPAEYWRFARHNLLPAMSYINNYAVIPAHDFWPVPASKLGSPEFTILVTERRDMLLSGLKLKSWKGTSGFSPGQPCQGKKLGKEYRIVTQVQAEDRLRHAKTDRELLLTRMDWTAHGEGSNYLFVDGHAVYQALAPTLRPQKYEWGERFYPQSMPNARCD